MEQATVEISPLQVIELEAILNHFCPVATEGGTYHEDICRLNGCCICSDLMLTKGGTA